MTSQNQGVADSDGNSQAEAASAGSQQKPPNETDSQMHPTVVQSPNQMHPSLPQGLVNPSHGSTLETGFLAAQEDEEADRDNSANNLHAFNDGSY